MDGAVVAGGGTDEAVNSGCGDALSRLQEDRGETNEGNEIFFKKKRQTEKQRQKKTE